MKSYLTHRQQYVQLNTFSSNIIESPNCLVVQGGKLSGLLYNIYVNELPILYKLLYGKSSSDLNINKSRCPSHTTIQFVDDSTNIIWFKQTDIMKLCLEKYAQLLVEFYTYNKLKIDKD